MEDAGTLSDVEARIDLVDGAFWGRDPHEELAWLRANAPVWRDPVHGVWAIATYDLVKHVSTHPRQYSSAGGIRPDHPGTAQLIDLDDAVLAEPLQDLAMLVSRLDGIMIEHADAYAGHGGPARVDGAAQAGLSELRDTLLARYLERMPDAWSARRLALHRVSALLLVALHFVQHLKPDWPLLVDRVLRHAWTLLRE